MLLNSLFVSEKSCTFAQKYYCMAKRLMRSYARLQGSMAPIPSIVEDLKTNEPESMSDKCYKD